MDLKIVFQNNYAMFAVDYLIFQLNGNTYEIKGNSCITPQCTVLKEITVNGDEISNEIRDLLKFATLIKMQINNAYGDVYSDAEIVKMELLDDENSFEFNPIHFGKFHVREIHLPGFHYKIKEDDYQQIAKYVRQQDKKENAINALENYDGLYTNIFKYLSEDDIENFAEDFDSVTDYTGEEEQAQIEKYIYANCGGVVYPVFVSNEGTENEIRQVIPLLYVQYEQLYEGMREYWNGGDSPEEYGGKWPTYFDKEGDTVSLEFVDDIILERR